MSNNEIKQGDTVRIEETGQTGPVISTTKWTVGYVTKMTVMVGIEGLACEFSSRELVKVADAPPARAYAGDPFANF